MRKAGVKNEAISVRLDDANTIAAAQLIISDTKASKDRRLRLIEALAEADQPQLGEALGKLVADRDKDIVKAALIALQRFNPPADKIAAMIPQLDADSQIAAMNLLASRADSSPALLQLVSSGKLDAKKVPQDVVAKLRLNAPDDTRKIWGTEKRQTTGEMQVEIDRVAKILGAGSSSPYEGIKVFNMACATCHRLFNQGGQIGPDLTAFKRDDLPNMLLNIVNPNAEIREGYVNYLVTTKDGRALSGFLADEDKQVVVIRGIDGASITVPRAQIAEMKPAGFSLMPEGLLAGLDEQQTRDLFAYLRSAQPLVR